MLKVPTLDDVARTAGVSAMTVSRVVRGSGPVSVATQAAVQSAIAALNYRPSAAARALATGAEERIVLLHRSSTTSAYLGDLLLGAIETASQAQLHIIVEAFPATAGSAQIMDIIRHARAAGVLLPPPYCDHADLIDALERRAIAAVAIAPDSIRIPIPSVSIDDGQAAYHMTRHLIALGHRHIGFVGGHPSHKSSERRLNGYKRALMKDALYIDEALIEAGDFTYLSGLKAASTLLSRPNPPTAIFACNDDMAAAVIASAHRRGIDIPGQLTVCGFDDTALASAIWPPLTTIRQPIKDMGQAAVKLLLGTIRRPKGPVHAPEPKHVKLPCTPILRQSHGAMEAPSLRA